MKCTARLIYYKKLTKTGKRTLFTSLPFNFELNTFLRSLHPKQQAKVDWNAEVCGGKIIAEIGCHEEPGWMEDDSCAELDINFICKDCKQRYHPGLPNNEYELNIWINEILDKIP